MPDEGTRNVILDGGAASTLRLEKPTCADSVDDWVRLLANEVVDTHAQFEAAGARILLACTFRTLPHLRSDWANLANRAVALAHEGADAAQVWATIGPASVPGRRWTDAGFDERVRLTAGWGAMAARCAADGVEGFAVQSFTDPIECAAAVAAVRSAVPQLPISASLTPRDDGRLLDGADPAPALLALRQAGASWVGFNCGSGPAAIEAAVARAPAADWAKPSRGNLGHDMLVEALVRLASRCRYVGGCCGVDPSAIAVLARATRLPFRSPGDELEVSEPN